VLSEPRAADGCRSASGSDRLGKTRGHTLLPILWIPHWPSPNETDRRRWRKGPGVSGSAGGAAPRRPQDRV